jgi:hypothetical protein
MGFLLKPVNKKSAFGFVLMRLYTCLAVLSGRHSECTPEGKIGNVYCVKQRGELSQPAPLPCALAGKN